MLPLLIFLKSVLVNLFKLVNLTRLLIINFIFIVVISLVFISLNTQDEMIEVADNSYLRLNLNGTLVERKQPINLAQQISKQLLESDQEAPQEFEVQTLINTIRHAQHDPRIVGIILELGGLQSGSLDQLSDIGDAINAFKNENKSVYAYSDNYTQSQYYLASYASEISLAPNGLVLLQGFAVNRLYYKEALNKLLITPHVFKVGTYKSFVEPFTEIEMSITSKDANRHWLNQLWQSYIENVLEQRTDIERLSQKSINPTLKELKKALLAASGDTAQYAYNVGLVDRLEHREQFSTNMRNKAIESGQHYTPIEYGLYSTTIGSLYEKSSSENHIAIVYGNGEIISGQSDTTSIADESFNVLLTTALNDNRIKAVVIRLNTPGGSAFASENIRQKILALKMAGKKVVVSMGEVTASGGYWIAAAADKIVASPTTLTGSIGIFGMFATVDKSLNKMGIYQDGVATNSLANVDITQPLNPELKEIFQMSIEHGYQRFIDVVSGGRGLTREEVDNVAQGRVWTGVDALDNGLIDKLGNLESSIQLAADLASLNEFDVVSINPPTSTKQAFIDELFSQAISTLPSSFKSESILMPLFSELNDQVNFMARLNDPQNRFAYCTMCKVQ